MSKNNIIHCVNYINSFSEKTLPKLLTNREIYVKLNTVIQKDKSLLSKQNIFWLK